MKKAQEPEHPHYSRSYELPDGTLVTADSFDTQECDHYVEIEAPSISDMVAVGEKPARIRSGSVNRLSEVEFAQMFLREFERLGYQPKVISEPLPEPISEAPVATTE